MEACEVKNIVNAWDERLELIEIWEINEGLFFSELYANKIPQSYR